MSDYSKGGRGKQAPYQSTHSRVPIPLKPLVEQFTEGYRQVVGTSHEKGYLEGVQKAIAKHSYPQDKPQKETLELVEDLQAKHEDMVRKFGECRQQLAEERLTRYGLEEKLEALQAVVADYQQNSKPTRNWTEANRLIAALKQLF